MADNNHSKSDDGHGSDHGGGSGGGHGKASGGGSGGGSSVAKLLRSPITWAVAGVGALLAVVFAGGVQLPSVGTTPPSSYEVSGAQDGADGSPPDVADRSQPGAPRSATRSRISARTCVSIVEKARDDYGRAWESELSRKERADCGRAIQEARLADRRSPQQAEGPRGLEPGAGDVEVRRLSVAYGDLDLSTSTGAERFIARLKNAAVRVCGGRPDIRDLAARRPFQECVERSMDSAVAQIRAPRVTALHRRSAG